MRLICPNCDAEYEVDASLVPPEGRDVQCSNCTHTWFQTRDLDGDDVEQEAAQAASLTPPQRSAADAKALDIIHEEVRREVRARASETSALETQTDLGLDAPTARPPQPQPRAPEVDPNGADDDAEIDDRSEGTKRELLPDIEEINSTLASAPDPADYEDEDDEVSAPARQRSGFRIGFGLMLMFTAAVLVLYTRAPELVERFPQYSEQLRTYVGFVDRMRVMLEAGAQALLEQVTALTERFGNRQS